MDWFAGKFTGTIVFPIKKAIKLFRLSDATLLIFGEKYRRNLVPCGITSKVSEMGQAYCGMFITNITNNVTTPDE